MPKASFGVRRLDAAGSLCDAILGNLLYTKQQGQAVSVTSGPDYVRKVTISSTVQTSSPPDKDDLVEPVDPETVLSNEYGLRYRGEI